MASIAPRSRRPADADGHRRHNLDAAGAAGAAGEAVPVTVWPIRSDPPALTRPQVHPGAGRPPVDAVIAHVLACYPIRGRRVVVDGDAVAAPERIDAMAAAAPLDLVVVAARGRAHTWVEPGRWPLAPGGLLVVVLPSPVPVDAVVARARAVGLRYLQHNVAFPADQIGLPAGTAQRPLHLAGGRHTRIHTDVLVFALPDHYD